jgi:uncharacterized protein YukE
MSSMIPEDYSAVKIAVSPNELTEVNTWLLDVLQVIANEINTVNATLNDLTLQWWTGSSSAAAQSYINQWNQAVNGVFGTQDDPTMGAFGCLAIGLGSASLNYAATEQWAQNAFTSLASGMNSGSSSGPQNVVNQPGQRVTAITEVF